MSGLEPSNPIYWGASPAPQDVLPAKMPIPRAVERIASGQEVIWKPQEGPQTALLECPIFEVFFGGARGGGKTEGSIGDWLQHSAEYGEFAVGLFVRRKLTQLAEVIARTRQIFPKLGATWNEQKKTWTMSNGARLRFAYLERDSDADEYQGSSFTRLYVEEMPNFPSPAPIMKLKATLRSARGVPCGMRATGNPGGPGHKWVKSRYIDPAPQGYKVITEREVLEIDGAKIEVKIDRVFIPSKIQDNKLLMSNDPTYILRLRQSGSQALVKAWLEGDWNIIDGAFFDEFVYEKHVLSTDWLRKIPHDAPRLRAMDWGSARPFSIGWYAISDGKWDLPAGAMVKYREWYGASGPNQGLKMSAELVAEGVLERERHERVTSRVADPSIFIQDGGPSIADMFSKKGCNWLRADNRRQPGWEQLRQRLVGDNGVPMLYFLESCEATIDCIPTLQHDENKPEDVDTDSEDHAGDETRYAVMSNPWAPRRVSVPRPNLSVLPSGVIFQSAMTVRGMIDDARRRRIRASREW